MKTLLALLGLVAGKGESMACVTFWIDEPKMPKSLIK